MEIGMRLPWPDGAHLDSGMVAESVVVGIKQHKQEGNWKKDKVTDIAHWNPILLYDFTDVI